MTDWITHQEGTEPPELAPAALVEHIAGIDRPYGEGRFTGRVDQIDWKSRGEYRPITDEHGHKYISAEGLEPWAKWVTTDEDGTVIQWADTIRPYRFKSGRWLVSVGSPCFCEDAPATHRHPGNYRDSLYRVWREDHD